MPEVQPTNNPVPSDHPADARDNFKRIDEFVNLQSSQTSPTRTGKTLDTLFGITERANDQIDRIGFEVPVAYASGLVMSRISQTVVFMNDVYHAINVPFTTSGTFETNNFELLRAVNSSDLNDSQEQIIGGEASIFPELINSNISNGSVIPSGTTHVRVSGNLFSITPLASGIVSLLTSSGCTIGATPVTFSSAISSSLVLSSGSSAERDLSDRFSDTVNVKDFGAVGDGVTDDTAAIQAAFNYVTGIIGGLRPTTIEFPSGTYAITEVVVNDLFDVTVNFNGCLIRGIATEATVSAIRLFNYANVKFHSLGALFTAQRGSYTYGLRLDGGPGGTIDPNRGLAREFMMTNSTVMRFRSGVAVGFATRNTNIGQTSFSNVHIRECGIGLLASGAQTIVSYVGGSTSGSPHADFDLPVNDISAVTCEGAVVSFSSTELVKTSGTTGGIIINNCVDEDTQNPFGTVTIGNSFIELSAIASIRRTYPYISSFASSLRINNCSGFSSSTGSNIVVVDPSYAGHISLTNSNIYSSRDAIRTSPAVDASIAPNCRVTLDENFYNKSNYPGNRFNHVLGGILTLNNEMFLRRSSLGGTTIVTSGSNLRFQNPSTLGRYSRNSTDFNAATGVFTVPSYGIPELNITVNVASQSNLTGHVAVVVNGTEVYRFFVVNGVISFNCTLSDLNAGDTVNFLATPSSPVTFGASAQDYIYMIAIL